jgi:stage III sporulation protein AF
MEWLREWLQQLLVLLVLAAFFDLLVSDQATHKYVKWVVSISILLALLAPLVQWVQDNATAQLQDSMQAQMDRFVATGQAGPLTASDFNVEALHDTQAIHLVEQQMASELAGYLQRVENIERRCMVALHLPSESRAVVQTVTCFHEQTGQSVGVDVSPQVQPLGISPIDIPAIEITETLKVVESERGEENLSATSIEIRLAEYIESELSLEVEEVVVE